MEELVSVIMPNYNGAKYIKDSIDSVLAQTYQNWELIIVDDCSTDNSLEVIAQYQDERIKVFKNEKNSGAAVSRNKAIENATGRYIAFLDSDDLWLENKLALQLEFMQKKDCAFSFTDYKVINQSGEFITNYSVSKDTYEYADILKHCAIGCLTVIYDCNKLGKIYMPTNATKREDFACWLQILKRGYIAVGYHQILAVYRVHTKSVSSNKFKMIKYQWNVYRNVEKISFFKSLYYLMNWAIKGILKYR